jgi:hypothetical protein
MTRSRDVADTQENLGGAVPPFVAGKNKLINGDFGIWQRGTSFTTAVYTADRWFLSWSGTTTVSLTRQAFTAGSAPVASYESQYFARFARTAGSADDYFLQRIEDARTFAGQTVTFSFWAKASANTTISQVYCAQSMGSGGSGGGGAGNFSGISITTSWARYSVTFVMPSIAGGTVGTNSFVEAVFKFGSAMGNITVDLWGIQLESGSVATPFQTASGSIGGELGLCQRYYQVLASNAVDLVFCNGYAIATTQCEGVISFPIMRTTPALSATTGTSFYKFRKAGGDVPLNSVTLALATSSSALLFNSSNFSGTAGAGGLFVTNNASAFIALSAEL